MDTPSISLDQLLVAGVLDPLLVEYYTTFSLICTAHQVLPGNLRDLLLSYNIYIVVGLLLLLVMLLQAN